MLVGNNLYFYMVNLTGSSTSLIKLFEHNSGMLRMNNLAIKDTCQWLYKAEIDV